MPRIEVSDDVDLSASSNAQQTNAIEPYEVGIPSGQSEQSSTFEEDMRNSAEHGSLKTDPGERAFDGARAVVNDYNGDRPDLPELPNKGEIARDSYGRFKAERERRRAEDAAWASRVREAYARRQADKADSAAAKARIAAARRSEETGPANVLLQIDTWAKPEPAKSENEHGLHDHDPAMDRAAPDHMEARAVDTDRAGDRDFGDRLVDAAKKGAD